MNTIPIIRRKLRPPLVSIPQVRRERLHALLQGGLEPSRRLSLVCAGPGYGKTSLVAEYGVDSGLPVAWYALDGGDRDLLVFLTYLHAACHQVAPQLSLRPLELARSAPDVEQVLQTVVGLLAEEVAEVLSDGGILVLDDFQAVGKVEAIVAVVQHLIQYFPDSWQIIVISRETPELFLPQLRVRQQLVELTARELRFNANELRELLHSLKGFSPSDEQTTVLLNRTDGWIASVVLACQALQGRSGASVGWMASLVKELEHPAQWYAYLAQEVFDQLPVTTQQFALLTAQLEVLEPDILRAGLPDADVMSDLRCLLDRQLLMPVMPDVTDEVTAYRYHPSYRRFLLSVLLERSRGIDVQAVAGRWGRLLRASEPMHALQLLVRAQALEEAAELVCELAPGMIANNQLESLKDILSRFGVAFCTGHARLCFYQAELHRLWGDFDAAVHGFDRALENAQTDALRGTILVHQAAIAVGRQDPESPVLFDTATRHLGSGVSLERAFLDNLRGAWALAQEQTTAAIQYYESAMAHYRAIQDGVGLAKVLNNLGLCYTRLGLFDAALATYRESVTHSESTGRYPHPMTIHNMAAIHIYSGAFEAAWLAGERAYDVAQLLKLRREQLFARLGLASAAMGLHDWRRAALHFEATRDEALVMHDKVIAAKACAGLAELALEQGQLARAKGLMDEALQLSGLPLEDVRQFDLAMVASHVMLRSGELEQARELLEQLLVWFASWQYHYRHAVVLYYRAQLALLKGDIPGLSVWRRQADALAERYDYRFLQEREGARLAQLAGSVSPLAGGYTEHHPALERQPTVVVPVIRIQCLGEFRVYVGERVVANRDWRGHKTKLILAYLLAHPQGVNKEALTDLLYGEMDTTRTAILVLISRLRHALEPDLDKQTPSRFVQFVDGRYGFNWALPYELDTQDLAWHFKEGMAQDQDVSRRRVHLARVIALHQGDFLSGLDTDGPWLTIERQRWHRMAQEAHAALIRSYLNEEDYNRALAAADGNLAFDAACEYAHQVKLLTLAELGNREAAIRHYAVMRQVFARELGTEPSSATEMIVRSIQRNERVRSFGVIS